MAPPCSCCGAHANIPLNLTPRTARITDLLNSNVCPLVYEEVSFRAELPVRGERITQLDDAIASARRALQSLVHQRHRELRDLNDIHTVMNPIRRLPQDVLREIFLICLDDQDPRADSLDTHGMPWVLLQVSSQWRAAGLTFSRLWSRVHVSFDTLALHPHPERLGHVLWLQLSRSKQYPLEVELSSYTHVSEMHPILPHLWDTSNRWRTLVLDLTDASVRNILVPVHGKLHALELVSTKAHDRYIKEDTGFDVLSDVRSAPALRALHIDGSPVSLCIPWSRLEEYVCHRPTFGMRPYYMDETPAVTDSNIMLLHKLDAARTFKSRCIDRFPPRPPQTPLRRQNLTSLWLEAPQLPDMGISRLLPMLDLPALRSFGWICGVADVHAVRDLLLRSNSTLTTLGLKPKTFSQVLCEFVQESEAVETLVLKDSMDPWIFSYLNGKLPCLSLLDLSEVPPIEVDEGKLWILVNARRKRLKDVRLPYGYEPTVPLEVRYAAMIKEGLRIGLY
ncbi:hypothetical protein CPB85DRAFT_1315554 [Mucidula mucida]|nr:hypothetical protein CPB85DRAFT_1315554 [Mucidula mucida]